MNGPYSVVSCRGRHAALPCGMDGSTAGAEDPQQLIASRPADPAAMQGGSAGRSTADCDCDGTAAAISRGASTTRVSRENLTCLLCDRRRRVDSVSPGEICIDVKYPIYYEDTDNN